MFLDAANCLSENILPSSFIPKCIAFIGKHATECVRTKSFLQISRKSLIKLISSDLFCLEEEDVFRCCLNWAKYKAGVTQHFTYWSEEEKNKVCSELSPIMDYVRLLLIDSKFFAEEVEPTGCVPIEFVLERYRFAALSGNQQTVRSMPSLIKKYTQNEKAFSFIPRLNNCFFSDTKLLKNEKCHFQLILNSWFGSEKQSWKLLYR